MSTFEGFTSAEKLAVAWARTESGLTDLLGSPPNMRCATRLPRNPTFPFLTIRELFTAPIGDTEATSSLLQCDAYGAKSTARTPDYESAEDVANALILAAANERGAALTDGDAASLGVVAGFAFRSKRPVEEPDTLWARFMVELVMYGRVEGA